MVNPRFVVKAVLSGQRLNINVPLTVAGTVNYIGVEAKCTSEWDDCTVACYMYQAATAYTAQLALIYDAERKLYYFPNAERLSLTAGEWAIWFVGVVAENGQEKYKITSETKYFTVYEYPFASSIPPGDISLDEEAIARATDAQNKANLLLDKYNAGEFTGPKGDPGDPAEIGFVQASVDNTTGNPGCVVTVTENPENTYNMQFAFSGIKGAKGDTGATGPKGDTGAQGAPGRNGTDGRDGVDGETIDDYVLVQAEQPTSETNKMWLKPSTLDDPLLVPTMEELATLANDVNSYDPIFNKLIHLPDNNSFYNKGSYTGTGTYKKLSTHSMQISGGSGTTYYNYPIHGTDRVVSGTNTQLVTRVIPDDFLPIPASGLWGSASYSLGFKIYVETTSSSTGRNLEFLLLGANVVEGAFTKGPVIISPAYIGSSKYGSTIVRLRDAGFAPLDDYTHYAIFVRTRARASSQTSMIYMETVQSPRYLASILNPDTAIETTQTASRAHAVGSFIILNSGLYKVTSAISSGDTIAVGTNVEQTSILEQFVASDGADDRILQTVTPVIAWELGTISASTGERDQDYSTDSTKITRIRNVLSFRPLSNVGYISIKPGYKFTLREYDRSGNYIGTPLGFTNTSQYFNFNPNHLYRYVAAHDDNSPILPEDAPLTVSYTVANDAVVETECYDRLERNPIIQSRYTDGDRKSLTLLHYSDIHASLYSMQDIQEFYDRNYNLFDDIINTGDLTYTAARMTALGNDVAPFSAETSYQVGDFLTYGGYLYRVTQAFSGEMKLSGYCEFWGRIRHEYCVNAYYQMPLGQKSLFVIGNHDTNICNYTAAENPVNNHKAMGIQEALTRYYANINSWGVVRPSSDVCYYYKDYATQKVRLICLDVQFWDSDNIELAWLESTLAGAITAGYSVIIAAHCIPGDITGYTGTNFTDYSYPDSVADYSSFGRYPSGAAIPAIETFIQNGGEFICWLCGHNHKNRIAKCTNSPNITVVQIENAGSFNSWTTHSNNRTATGLYSRTCANAVSVNTDDKLLKLVRFGTNIDSHMRKADYLCFDYSTHQVIV